MPFSDCLVFKISPVFDLKCLNVLIEISLIFDFKYQNVLILPVLYFKYLDVLIEILPGVAFEGFELFALCSCKHQGQDACSPKPGHYGHHSGAGDPGQHRDAGHEGHYEHHGDFGDVEGEDEDIQ